MSRTTAYRILKELAEEQVVQQQGSGSATKYFLINKSE